MIEKVYQVLRAKRRASNHQRPYRPYEALALNTFLAIYYQRNTIYITKEIQSISIKASEIESRNREKRNGTRKSKAFDQTAARVQREGPTTQEDPPRVPHGHQTRRGGRV